MAPRKSHITPKEEPGQISLHNVQDVATVNTKVKSARLAQPPVTSAIGGARIGRTRDSLPQRDELATRHSLDIKYTT